ncbi:hypothetical protein G3578_20400 [Brevibacillus sp. SYP-B805]|uniref:hypothetical protein n=1 Tax=Brevibacillus sp. SYP-B805 TaxID=1578199 RepID=UPI0013EE059B|nr:hypothetical protein [Brevibacillus sp. SYP-B805]NGQ97502.1 hypothetical protein [Brevibacillus sp. SYP-B805]
MKLVAISITLILLMNFNALQANEIGNVAKKEPATENCINKIDEFEPAIMWNNITYKKNYESDTTGLRRRGKKIGEVAFKMNGMVCPGYKMKNGDATWAKLGTPVYQVTGYKERLSTSLKK